MFKELYTPTLAPVLQLFFRRPAFAPFQIQGIGLDEELSNPVRLPLLKE